MGPRTQPSKGRTDGRRRRRRGVRPPDPENTLLLRGVFSPKDETPQGTPTLLDPKRFGRSRQSLDLPAPSPGPSPDGGGGVPPEPPGRPVVGRGNDYRRGEGGRALTEDKLPQPLVWGVPLHRGRGPRVLRDRGRGRRPDRRASVEETENDDGEGTRSDRGVETETLGVEGRGSTAFGVRRDGSDVLATGTPGRTGEWTGPRVDV